MGWRRYFERARRDEDLAQEITSYIEHEIDENLARGMSVDEARRAAQRKFGNSTLVREAVYEMNTLTFIEAVWQDLKHALRQLRKDRTFLVTALGTLALCIGASVSVYALVRGLYFRAPDGVTDPDQLVGISQQKGGELISEAIRYPDYLYYRDHQTVFSGLASHFRYVLVDTERSEDLDAFFVSSNYFSVLGVTPSMGRFFGPASENDPVVILSYSFWQRRFGANANCVGQTLILGGVPFTITGVAAPNFKGALVGWPVDVFVPTMMARTAFPDLNILSRDSAHLNLLGRLRPDRTIATARTEMTALARQLEQAFPETNRDLGVGLYPLQGIPPEMRPPFNRLILLLTAAVSCFLLAACVNLAGLVMARNTAREKDIATQLALGASRARIIQQLAIESVVLSLFGGAASLPVAFFGSKVLASYFSVEIFGTLHSYAVGLDWSAFLVSFLLAVCTGLLFGVIPALRASRPDLVPGFKVQSAGSGFRRSWLQTGVLVAQVALSMVALVGAALATRSVGTLRWNPGFRPEHVAYLRMKPWLSGYDHDAARTTRHLKLVQERLSSLSQVESLAFVRWTPPMWPQTTAVFLPGQAPARPEDSFHVAVNAVTPGFFETLSIPIIQGRGFEEKDLDASRDSVVINEALAERMWPQTDPVGRILMVGSKPYDATSGDLPNPVIVVGVARYQGVRAEGDAHRPFMFRAEFGSYSSRLLVRLRGEPERLLPSLVREIVGVDPTVAISEQLPLSRLLQNMYAPVTLTMVVLTFTGGLTLLLTAIGLYGALAVAVGQRTREIGIRMALGARPSGILRLVLLEGLVVTIFGIAIGVATATVLTDLLTAYLFGVQRNDPLTFAAVTLVLVCVAMAACALPASRAAHIEPNVALRQE